MLPCHYFIYFPFFTDIRCLLLDTKHLFLFNFHDYLLRITCLIMHPTLLHCSKPFLTTFSLFNNWLFIKYDEHWEVVIDAHRQLMFELDQLLKGMIPLYQTKLLKYAFSHTYVYFHMLFGYVKYLNTIRKLWIYSDSENKHFNIVLLSLINTVIKFPFY